MQHLFRDPHLAVIACSHSRQHSAGNTPALGSWDTNNAPALSASTYTSDNPAWTITLYFPPGVVLEYKFVKIVGDGAVMWESGPDRSYTVPCGAATVTSSWR